jgi:hypothetical protein
MATNIAPVSNDAEALVAVQQPERVTVTIEGVTPILFHRWSTEEVAEKAKAPKNSAVKKTDNLETMVYRTEAGHLALPSEYLRASLVQAARFFQDPRSPRKSLMDLAKAAFVISPLLADLGQDTWDYVDRRRVMVQRNAVTRERPALREGWRATFTVELLLPEYLGDRLLYELLTAAGRFVGVGDFRPTYGRFRVISFTADPGVA